MLAKRPSYYCVHSDIKYALETARQLNNDPFKIADMMRSLMESQHRDRRGYMPVVAREGGLRGWLIAEFMQRRGLKPTQNERAAYKDIFGQRLQWPFGGCKYEIFDHTFWFRFKDESGYLIATHPYNPVREEWAAVPARVEFPDDYPSWWYPGVTPLIVCIREGR
jgi:hypothetical protein